MSLLTLYNVIPFQCTVCTTSSGADCPTPDTSHLFSVLSFPPFPILYKPYPLSCITMACHYTAQPKGTLLQVSPASSLGVVCNMPQDFKHESFFRKLHSLPLCFKKSLHSKQDKIHSNWDYKALAHFNHIRQLFTASCGFADNIWSPAEVSRFLLAAWQENVCYLMHYWPCYNHMSTPPSAHIHYTSTATNSVTVANWTHVYVLYTYSMTFLTHN